MKDTWPHCGLINIPATPAVYSAAELLEQAKIARIAEITALQNVKLYTNITTAFPSGAATIQMRNADDWMNFLSAVTDATLLPAASPVSFRTLDNVTQTLTAAQLIAIGAAVLAVKKAILAAGWAHDDAVRALTAPEAVTTYDITIGWPA